MLKLNLCELKIPAGAREPKTAWKKTTHRERKGERRRWEVVTG